VHSLVLVSTSPDIDLEEMESRVRALISVAQENGDLRALLLLRIVEADVWLVRAQFEKVVEVAELLLPAARAVGDRPAALHAIIWMAGGPWLSPTPVSQGIEDVARVRALAEGPVEEAAVFQADAALYAMQGRFSEARELARRAKETFLEFGMPAAAAGSGLLRGFVEFAAGDAAGAERELRASCDELRALGETGFLSTNLGYLADALYQLGRLDEADAATRESEETSNPSDAASQAIWRSVRARILARRGSFDEAERLAREAVAWNEMTDGIDQTGSSYAALGEVLELAGRREEAVAAYEHALDLFARKGHEPNAARTRALLAELRL
jgi:tetratricopeptide (TPR) repeat protein